MIIEKVERLSLAGGQTLVLTRKEHPALPLQTEDVLQILGPQGRPTVVIRVGQEGAQVELAGGPVVLRVDGDLRIEAERLQLHARDRLSLSSGRDAEVVVEESLATTAKRQSLTSTLGDVRIFANDDVRMDGERIRMNC
jgi:hypothetical protein